MTDHVGKRADVVDRRTAEVVEVEQRIDDRIVIISGLSQRLASCPTPELARHRFRGVLFLVVTGIGGSFFDDRDDDHGRRNSLRDLNESRIELAD